MEMYKHYMMNTPLVALLTASAPVSPSDHVGIQTVLEPDTMSHPDCVLRPSVPLRSWRCTSSTWTQSSPGATSALRSRPRSLWRLAPTTCWTQSGCVRAVLDDVQGGDVKGAVQRGDVKGDMQGGDVQDGVLSDVQGEDVMGDVQGSDVQGAVLGIVAPASNNLLET